jgi:hypothetical protein
MEGSLTGDIASGGSIANAEIDRYLAEQADTGNNNNIINAVDNVHWVNLDEISLAPTETKHPFYQQK